MMASEGDASTENNIRIRGTLPAANHRLTVCGLLFELFVRRVTNFYGVSLVLLQLLNVAEQRFVELRIMLFDFRGTGKPASQTTSVSVCPRRDITDEISELRTVPFFIFLLH